MSEPDEEEMLRRHLRREAPPVRTDQGWLSLSGRLRARRIIRIVRWPLVVVCIVVAVALIAAAGRGCFAGSVPHFAPGQLQSAVINLPPLTPKTRLDLGLPDVRDKLVAAYQQLRPWGEEQGRVFPDVELRLQLSDGRTIGVAYQKDDPEMLVRVYRSGKLRSEIHVRGSLMYYLLLSYE